MVRWMPLEREWNKERKRKEKIRIHNNHSKILKIPGVINSVNTMTKCKIPF